LYSKDIAVPAMLHLNYSANPFLSLTCYAINVFITCLCWIGRCFALPVKLNFRFNFFQPALLSEKLSCY